MTKPFIGITVLPEFAQSEGVDSVLDRLVSLAGATAVTTSPYVMEPADAETGAREPPDDAGAGKVRVLDRPLWGKRELFVRTSPSFVPDKALYRDLRYQPAEPTELTRREGKIVAEFIRAAQSRHLKVYLQVQAAIPPGYRVQFGGPLPADQPRLPNGSVPARRLAKNGSLASPHIREYTRALIRDVCREYPHIDGLRIDWPEYPPYLLDDFFLDFSEHAREAARRLGFDFDRMQRDAREVYQRLNGALMDHDVRQFLADDGGRYGLASWLLQHVGFADLLRFKGALSLEVLASIRQAMNEAGANRMELIAHAFPPPWNLASGIDFRRIGEHASAVCVKFYTMHWAMMLRFYADQLLAANRGLSDAVLGIALSRMFDVWDGERSVKATDYHYTEPDETHPIGYGAMQRKLRHAIAEAGTTPVFALGHGYGPSRDFRRRLETLWECQPPGIWLNRYGYLSDEKLQIVGQVSRG